MGIEWLFIRSLLFIALFFGGTYPEVEPGYNAGIAIDLKKTWICRTIINYLLPPAVDLELATAFSICQHQQNDGDNKS